MVFTNVSGKNLTNFYFIFSYDDGIDEAVNSNFQVMFGGFSLLFLYLAATLGRWNTLEQRVSKINRELF